MRRGVIRQLQRFVRCRLDARVIGGLGDSSRSHQIGGHTCYETSERSRHNGHIIEAYDARQLYFIVPVTQG
jgi:hypothetical protein